MNLHIKRFLKNLGYIALDIVIIIGAWFLSIWFYSYLFSNEAPLISVIWSNIIGLSLVSFAIFALLGMYKSLWRYSSVGSLLRVGLTVLVVCFVFYVFFRLQMGYWQSPAIPVMAFFISFTLCGTVRLFPRIIQSISSAYNIRFKKDNLRRIPTLIVGAGQAGSMLILETLKNKTTSKYNVIALIDDDDQKRNMFMHGVEVIGGRDYIPLAVKNLGIKQIIIAMPSATKRQLREIMDYCPTDRCKVSILPEYDARISSIRDINFADLLGRDEAQLDIGSIEKMIKDKTILVTGGGGSIGSELCRQLLHFDIEKIVVYDFYENNAYNLYQEIKATKGDELAEKLIIRIGSVQDESRVRQVFEEFHPSVIFHAAAYKHVPLMEECPSLAIKNNVFGTYNVAKTAKEYGAQKFVMISTDKAVNPTNIMGASKRLAEKVVMSLNEPNKTEFVCVRFGNVLGSNGSVIPIFERQIENGGPVTVTDPEITRFFMTIPEAAKLVIQAAAMAKSGTIFVLDMGEPIKIAELAKNMIRLSGYEPDKEIKIVFTGLRPGEKLYEELLTNEEDVTKTENAKIFSAKLNVTTPEETNEIIYEFNKHINNDNEIRNYIKRFVPEYEQKSVNDEHY